MKEEFKKYLAMILAVFCTAALSILFFFVLFRMDALRSLIGRILEYTDAVYIWYRHCLCSEAAV